MELPRAFLCDLAETVSFPGLFQGPSVGLTRGRKRHLGLRIINLALVAPEVDGHLQFMPLLHQPKTLGLEAHIYIRELSAKPTHWAHRLPKELMADDAPFVRNFERAAGSVLHSRGRRRGLKWLAPFLKGAGGWRPPDADWASAEAQLG